MVNNMYISICNTIMIMLINPMYIEINRSTCANITTRIETKRDRKEKNIVYSLASLQSIDPEHR